jgi:hypothetical protein
MTLFHANLEKLREHSTLRPPLEPRELSPKDLRCRRAALHGLHRSIRASEASEAMAQPGTKTAPPSQKQPARKRRKKGEQ